MPIHQLNTSGTITATYATSEQAAQSLGIKQPVLEYHLKHGTPAKIKGYRFVEVSEQEPSAITAASPQAVYYPDTVSSTTLVITTEQPVPSISAILPEPASETDSVAPQIQVYPPLSRTEQLANITKQKRRQQ